MAGFAARRGSKNTPFKSFVFNADFGENAPGCPLLKEF
jgi:hypothetical protein